MNYKFYVIIFCAIIGSIQTNDDRDLYKSLSLDKRDILTNDWENFQIVEIDQDQDKVKVELYYECFCPYCRGFETIQFKDTVQALSQYLDVHMFPYGNAETKTVSGHFEFTCQHGPGECYGNMLHACAIDYLKNITLAVLYNSCMMGPLQDDNGSDDAAADKCGKTMGIDSAQIKACAKSDAGATLLNFYGEASSKVGFNYVPYILINGNKYMYSEVNDFKITVCAAFKNQPPPCK